MKHQHKVEHILDINSEAPYSNIEILFDRNHFTSATRDVARKVISEKIEATANIRMKEKTLLFKVESKDISHGKMDEQVMRSAFTVLDFEKAVEQHKSFRQRLKIK